MRSRIEHGYLLACNFDQPYDLTETSKKAVPLMSLHACMPLSGREYWHLELLLTPTTSKIIVTTQVLASVEILLVMNYAVYPRNSAAAALLAFVPSSFP